jgi:LuxR family maltose regulon positive regulatory protein
MGELLLERDDLEASERQLTLGTELVERAGEREILARGQVTLSRVKWARGDAEGALKLAYEAERLARKSGSPQAIAGAAFWKARLHLMRNDLRAAASELERASDVDDVPRSTQDAERISQARLLVAREDHDEALQMLNRLRETAEAADKRGNVVEVLTLQALVVRAREEKGRALDVMGRALALAEPEGYVRTFVDEGPPMAELLSEVLEAQQRGRPDSLRRVPAHYLRKLLAALERDVTGTARPATDLPEALSARELEVLQLIAAGKSNRRIASELFVSVGTVKTHLNNLYRKLDSHSRTQAVARARDLELL